MGTKLVQDIIESNYYDTFVFHLCNKAILRGYKILECSNFQFSKNKTLVPVGHIGINLAPFKMHSIQMSNNYQYNTTSPYSDISSKVFKKITLTRIWVSYEVPNDVK